MLRVRFANIDDIKQVFELSNDEMVRKNSINKEKILWQNHVLWYEDRIKRTNEPFYVVEDENQNFIAQVRFDVKDENIISISLASEYRGKGLSAQIIKICSEKFNKRPVIAYVKEKNVPSLKAFLRAGYEKSGNKTINNENYIRLCF